MMILLKSQGECGAKLRTKENSPKHNNVKIPNFSVQRRPKLVILCIGLQFVIPAKRQHIINTNSIT